LFVDGKRSSSKSKGGPTRELKAAAAREATKAAAREEIEATRNEFAATREQEGPLEVMALEVVAPEVGILSTTTRR